MLINNLSLNFIFCLPLTEHLQDTMPCIHSPASAGTRQPDPAASLSPSSLNRPSTPSRGPSWDLTPVICLAPRMGGGVDLKGDKQCLRRYQLT